MALCLQCSDYFHATTRRKLYCSNRCRSRYNREQNSCFYCGEIANTREHTYPQSCEQLKGFAGSELVPACKECNIFAGDHHPNQAILRMQHLRASLRKRYKLHKPMPVWSPEELDDLGTSLRSAVEQKLCRQERARNRVLYLEAQIYLVSQKLECCRYCGKEYDTCDCGKELE